MKRIAACLALSALLIGAAHAGPPPEGVVKLFKESCLDHKPNEFDLRKAAGAAKHFLLRQNEIGDFGSPTIDLGLVRTSGYRLPGGVTLGIQKFDGSDKTNGLRCTFKWLGNADETPAPQLTALLGAPSSEAAGVSTWSNVAGPWDSVVLSYKVVGGVFILYAQVK